MAFQKATKHQSKLRLALLGPSGSGKSFTSLKIAMALAAASGTRVAAIDSERGSLSKYAGEFDFDVEEFTNFSPENYIKSIEGAGKEGYGVLIVDSLSHAWMGKGGALEMVDNVSKRGKTNNSFGAWREVTPVHNRLVDTILAAPLHIIVTMRVKMDYVQDKDEKTGKTVVRKVGLQPVQRDGLEYEFDVIGDMDLDNNLIIGKTRCSELHGKLFEKPGADVAGILLNWLSQGAPAPAAAKAPPPAEPFHGASPEQIKELKDLLHIVTLPNGLTATWLKKAGAVAWEDMPFETMAKCLEYLRQKADAQVAGEGKKESDEPAPAGEETHDPPAQEKPDLSTWDSFLKAAAKAAEVQGLQDMVAFTEGIKKAVLGTGKKGKEESITLITKSKWYEAIQAGAFDFSTGKINDVELALRA